MTPTLVPPRDDDDRRHLFRVPVDRAAPEQITSGETLEWQPVMAGDARVAFIATGAQQPPGAAIASIDGTHFEALEQMQCPRISR